MESAFEMAVFLDNRSTREAADRDLGLDLGLASFALKLSLLLHQPGSHCSFVLFFGFS